MAGWSQQKGRLHSKSKATDRPRKEKEGKNQLERGTARRKRRRRSGKGCLLHFYLYIYIYLVLDGANAKRNIAWLQSIATGWFPVRRFCTFSQKAVCPFLEATTAHAPIWMTVADLRGARIGQTCFLVSSALSLPSRDIHFLEGNDDLKLLFLIISHSKSTPSFFLLGLPSSTELIAPSRAPFKACIWYAHCNRSHPLTILSWPWETMIYNSWKSRTLGGPSFSRGLAMYWLSS